MSEIYFDFINMFGNKCKASPEAIKLQLNLGGKFESEKEKIKYEEYLKSLQPIDVEFEVKKTK